MGVAILRAIVGLLFMGHGLQKLKGWFGGPGPEGTGQFFETLGLRPGKRHAVAAGSAEMTGGALLALGLLTPLSAALLTGTMATAIKTVHLPNGPWVAEGGWEYNAVLIALLFAVTDVGPGRLSLDRRLSIELSGPGWAIAELAAGLGGAAANLKQVEPEATGAPQPGDPATAQSPAV
jgi:putative oxidoreductase